MTTIITKTNDQVLSASILPKVACNNQKTVRLHVDFDDAWSGFAKSAVFYTEKDKTRYEAILSGDGDCLIPAEVLADEGKLYIGVKGVKNDTVKTSTILTVKVLAGTPSMIISDPTADVYAQLLQAYATERARIDNLAKLPTGSTAGDAELADIRIGEDGTTYNNAGEAVRNQVAGRVSRKTKGYVYPPQGANIDISSLDDGSVAVKVFAGSLTAITPGSSEYGGVAITKEQILSQLPSNSSVTSEGHVIFTVPSYNALCFNGKQGILVVKSIRTITGDDKVLVYNAWGNACGGSFMEFFNRQEHAKNLEAHNEIIDFIGDQKTLVYIGSDKRVTVKPDETSGWAHITLEAGISYTVPTGDTSTTAKGISFDDIVSQLGETRAVVENDKLTISLNTYQALCLNLETEQLLFRHIRNIKPADIVLLYNSWANVQGMLLNKSIDHDVRNLKKRIGEGSEPLNIFNSGDISYGIETTNKCKEFANLFNNSAETESFLYFTDPHLTQKGESYEANLKKYLITIQKYFNSTPTSFVLCGGDWLGNSDTQEEAKYKLGYIDGVTNSMFEKYYPVLGNHDTNYQGVDQSGNANTGILGNNTIANLWFRNQKQNYYAFDGSNTRFYVLDSGTDWDNSLSEYRLAQIDWLANKLKTEDKTHSAIAVHIYYSDTQGNLSNFAVEIEKIVKAYNQKATVAINGVAYNFLHCKGTIEFVITGHTHKDMQSLIDGKTPVICTLNTREGNTPSFDLVYADYDNRKISLVRVGSGSNRVFNLASK